MMSNSMNRAIGRWVRTAVACASLMLGGAVASAQMGGFGGANFRPALNSGEIDRMIEALAMDADQADLVRSLFAGFRETYEQASRDAQDRMRDMFREARESGQFQNMASMGLNTGREWQKRSEALVQSFFSDVQTVLTKEQQGQWDRYQREWRRRNSMRGGGQPGALAGENIDLFDLVDRIELEDEEYDRIDPVLEAYAIELDPALSNRDRAVQDMMNLSSALLEGKSTIEDLESKFKAVQRSRVQVRDVNDRYVQHLGSHLPPEKAQALERAYRQQSFRGIYSPTRADGYFETVRRTGTLSDPQKSALEMIERDFRSQTDQINRQLAELQKKRELEDQQRFFERITAMAQGAMGQQRMRGEGGPGAFFGGGPGAQDDPRQTLFQQKEDLVESTLNTVVALLTPEQLAAAPKPERRRGGWRGAEDGGRQFDRLERLNVEQRMRERGGQTDEGGRNRRGN